VSLPLSTEQQQLRDTIRSWFAEHYSLAEVRKVFSGERAPLDFNDIEELGLKEAFSDLSSSPASSSSSATAGAAGGAGWGLRELGIVAFEVGFALAPARIHLALLQSDDNDVQVSAGSETVSFTKDLSSADRSKALDRTQCIKIASTDLSNKSEGATEVSLLACEAAGVCARAIEITKEYVSTRKQFGKVIGTFQAVQHKLADLFLTAEALRTTSEFACWAGAHSPSQVALSSAASATLAHDTVCRVVEGCIQLHGGIGFTWEHDLHLFLRRAKVLQRALRLTPSREEILLSGRSA
jgi:hypothetical protein